MSYSVEITDTETDQTARYKTAFEWSEIEACVWAQRCDCELSKLFAGARRTVAEDVPCGAGRFLVEIYDDDGYMLFCSGIDDA